MVIAYVAIELLLPDAGAESGGIVTMDGKVIWLSTSHATFGNKIITLKIKLGKWSNLPGNKK